MSTKDLLDFGKVPQHGKKTSSIQLKMVSLRLPKQLIKDLKNLSYKTAHKLKTRDSYQRYVRNVLINHVEDTNRGPIPKLTLNDILKDSPNTNDDVISHPGFFAKLLSYFK